MAGETGLLFDVGPEPVDAEGVRSGDCVELMRAMPAGSVDLVVADPPYNVGYGYDVYEDGKSAGEYLAWCRRWGEQVARVLKPDGTFWLVIGDEFAAELKVLFHRDLGLHPRSWVVWYYSFGVNSPNKFTRSHAHLFYFVKDPKRFTFDAAAVRVPSARQLVYADKRANAAGRLPDDTWVLRPADAEAAGALAPDHDVWHVPRVNGTFKERVGWHPCQLPERLVERVVRACSRPGDLVLDPFAGSGTTLVVARKLGRKSLGFELSADYARRAAERLAAVREGDEIAGGAAYAPAARQRRGDVAGDVR